MSLNRKYLANTITKILKNDKNKRVKSKKISNTISIISKNRSNKKSSERNYSLKKRQTLFKRRIKLVISKIVNTTSENISRNFLKID